MAIYLSRLSIVNGQSSVVSEISWSNARCYLTESHERRHISWCVGSAHTHMCTRPLQTVHEHAWNCSVCLVSSRSFLVGCTEKCEWCWFMFSFSSLCSSSFSLTLLHKYNNDNNRKHTPGFTVYMQSLVATSLLFHFITKSIVIK